MAVTFVCDTYFCSENLGLFGNILERDIKQLSSVTSFCFSQNLYCLYSSLHGARNDILRTDYFVFTYNLDSS